MVTPLEVIVGTGPVPVPVKLTDCGLPEALSEMVTAAFSAEAKVGLNITLRVQLAPAATELGQVLAVRVKSPALGPVT